VSRRQLLLLPALLSAMALPVAPALAGEDDPTAPAPGTAPVAAKLNVKQGCVIGIRAKVVVTAPLRSTSTASTSRR
jgi:hypothetical protein